MCDRYRFEPPAWALACLCCILGATGVAAGQGPAVPAGPLSLEQVLELAEGRSEAVAAARAGVTRTEGERLRARSDLFPQLSVSASYDRALASEFEGVFDDGLFGGGPEEDPATADGLEDLPFGRENTWRASLSLSQTIYSGGRIGAQQAIARAGRDTAELGLTTSRAQVLFEATQAYYDAALSERLVTIAEASLQQSGATLQQVQAGFDAGTQPEFEVLRARVARDNQTPLLIRQRVNRDLALLRLKRILDLPPDYDLRLTDPLGDESLAPPAVFAERVAAVESTLKPVTTESYTLQSTAALPDRTSLKLRPPCGCERRRCS
jgi:outer membrane protein TolC